MTTLVLTFWRAILQGYSGDVRVCNSPAKHIGGDEWDYYCKQVGADMGKA